jgi:hypothetical protein
VQLQTPKAVLDTQSTVCNDPTWAVKLFPQYKRSGCDSLGRDSVTVDIKGGQKTLEGARTTASYDVADDKKVETQLGAQRNFLVAFKAMGAAIVSDPDNPDTVVATQKLPQGEFWYIYRHTGGNSESTGSYSLTTVQITAFDQQVVVQPMTAALPIPTK